ncbi:uncharacterized protein K441DRAFT_647322 [Cenococcum geophilum 1.58]|uniref:Uncharacterized protein n=1 Tax=Cenococcum geophilum 1.58 TaxID=794803 RepID=A0ACC8ENZ3_9PEZI|nr:hypothetical protein K441DRAFT_647322 [Cenococcum geophilum 1.58]
MTGERGRLYITRRVWEKSHPDCIQSVYRSGRTSFMVWGAIGWGWKLKLVFLERRHGKRGINSRDYAEQVLEEVVGPFLQDMEPDTIFMEDGAKVHLGFAKAVRKALNIRGFSQWWPPSSPDLNPIEKVWRWIKARITQMDKFPTTLDELKQVV